MERRQLDDSVSLVSGGSRGVGLAIADALAAGGSDLGLLARSDPELADAADALAKHGRRVAPIPVDVTDASAAAEAVEELEGSLGPIDLLVNAAATCEAIGPLWEVDPGAWWRDVETSLLGTFVLSRVILPSMIERGRGRIINISSYAANRPAAYMSAYGAAKAAVAHLTDSLAAETKGHGVSVFALTPGTVRTALTRSLTESKAGRTWLPQIPPDRWLPLELVGEAALLLATGRADRLSGRFLHVLDDLPALAGQADAVEAEDLYVLRLRK